MEGCHETCRHLHLKLRNGTETFCEGDVSSLSTSLCITIKADAAEAEKPQQMRMAH